MYVLVIIDSLVSKVFRFLVIMGHNFAITKNCLHVLKD